MTDDDGIARDANGYAYRDYPASRHAREQPVLNEDWPLRDKAGNRHANGINDQPPGNQRQVLVRVELRDDGEVVIPGRAVRWNQTHVYVCVDDPRVPRRAVWVCASDVRPRTGD